MGNYISSNKKPNKYGSSKRIYVYPQFDKLYEKYLNLEKMTKKTPTQNLSDPMLIGKFDQKISKLFEEKRRFLPNPQLKKPMIQISPNELNNMRNDINVLRNILQIEINHKNSLLIKIQKNQNRIFPFPRN